MPRSTVTRFVGCYELIALEDEAVEFYHREEIDFPGGTTVDVRPDYTHGDHAELANALGYLRTGRTGVLSDLHDLPWPPKRT
jgi:hypothetical protein